MTGSRDSNIRLPPLKDLEVWAGVLDDSPASGYQASSLRQYTQWKGRSSILGRPPLSPPLDSIDPRESEHHLSVPTAAENSAGGWFDPERWLYKLVFSKVGNKSIEELVKMVFYRETRPRYGEDHTSTRSKKAAEHSRGNEEQAELKQTSSDAHKQQEQDRRFRHRIFQHENDECTGTFVSDLAEQMLPYIKETINKMPREVLPSTDADRKIKRIGKDEQLAAAALMPHVNSILIFKLYNALSTSNSIRDQQEAQLKYEQTCRLTLEDRAHHLKRQNECLSEELCRLRSERDRLWRKRPADSMEDGVDEAEHHPREIKWPRMQHLLHPEDRSSQHQLPLSPRSEGGEFTPSFSSSASTCYDKQRLDRSRPTWRVEG